MGLVRLVQTQTLLADTGIGVTLDVVVVKVDLCDMDSELGHVLFKVVNSVTPVLASVSLG